MPYRTTYNRRHVLLGITALAVPGISSAQPAPSTAEKLIAAATRQIGVTKIYDPAYVRLAFPLGDVPADRGVCTDVIVRAYREAFGVDLQAKVNADMKASFAAYPKRWGLAAPDANIDHRRVGNLQTFFARQSLTDQDAAEQRRSGACPQNHPHFIVGITNSAPSFMPLGQRDVTVLVLV